MSILQKICPTCYMVSWCNTTPVYLCSCQWHSSNCKLSGVYEGNYFEILSQTIKLPLKDLSNVVERLGIKYDHLKCRLMDKTKSPARIYLTAEMCKQNKQKNTGWRYLIYFIDDTRTRLMTAPAPFQLVN